MLKNAVKLSVLYMTRKLQSSTPDSKIQFAQFGKTLLLPIVNSEQFLLNYRKCFVNYPIVLKDCINTVFVYPCIFQNKKL